MGRTDPTPVHPGLVLREQVLQRLGLSVSQAALELGVARQTLHRVLAGTASVSPEMALRLGRLTGTAASGWLRLQQAHDLWHARRELQGRLPAIPVHTLPKPLPAELKVLNGD